MNLNNNKTMKSALKALKRPSPIGWLLVALLILALSIPVNVFAYKWLPWLRPVQSGQAAAPVSEGSAPLKSPRLALNYPTSAKVGENVRIVITYTEDGFPVEGIKANFVNNLQQNGSFIQYEPSSVSTDKNGQASVLYAPAQEGVHEILVSLPDKNIQSIASIQAYPSQIQIDSDGDGLSDMDEIKIGTFLDSPDTDGDGLSDGDEFYSLNTDPRHSNLLETIQIAKFRSEADITIPLYDNLPAKTKVFDLNQLKMENTTNVLFGLVFLDGRVKKSDFAINKNNPILNNGTVIINLISDSELLINSSPELPVQVLNEDETYYYVRIRGYIAENFLSNSSEP